MSLATRLSAFFSIALLLVLAGFSITLYGLARVYLIGQLDERLETALDTLEASVDIEPGGLEWEPADRRMMLGVDPGPTSIRWAVRSEGGVVVDRSANGEGGKFPAAWNPVAWPVDRSDGTRFGTSPGWRIAARRLVLDELIKQGRGHPEDAPGYEKRYPVLVLVVGLVPGPVEATLSRLLGTLVVLSAVIWASAALMGRWLCVRALAPMMRMAQAATSMTAAELERRLPLPTTRDELEELGRSFNNLLERRQEAFLKLDDAFHRQRRFAGDASHELRTPLAALLGQTQVALRRGRTCDEYRRTLSRVHDEGSRLKSIVESLLLLAQPDGSGPLSERLDLGRWVHAQHERWKAHPRGEDLQFKVDEDGPLIVLANPLLLAQLIDNVIENAWKYSKLGTLVVVQVGREHGNAVLSVSDEGCGLSAEEVASAFEPFFRTDGARSEGIPGVGLGLAIARRIAVSSGGTLHAESTPGVGSRFILRLPEIGHRQPEPIKDSSPAN